MNSLEEIKRGLASLRTMEQEEVAVFLFHLRRHHDADHQAGINSRLSDHDAAHWLTPEEFERRLDQRQP